MNPLIGLTLGRIVVHPTQGGEATCATLQSNSAQTRRWPITLFDYIPVTMSSSRRYVAGVWITKFHCVQAIQFILVLLHYSFTTIHCSWLLASDSEIDSESLKGHPFEVFLWPTLWHLLHLLGALLAASTIADLVWTGSIVSLSLDASHWDRRLRTLG